MPDQASQGPIVFALGARRASGKDTLCHLLTKLNPRVRRLAFADAIKADIAPFLHEQFGIDPRTAEGADKELIRSILIAFGCAKRAVDIDYWVKRVIAEIDKVYASYPSYQQGAVPLFCVTDCRFPSEEALLRKTYPSFKLIDVQRVGGPPPTEEETKHVEQMEKLADLRFVWGNDDDEARLVRATEVASWLGILPPPVEERVTT